MRACIRSAAGLAVVFCLCTFSWVATTADSSSQAQRSSEQQTVLSDAVRVALKCELDGNDVDRNALLLHLVDQDPGFRPVRWHLGQVRVNDTEWAPHGRFVDDQIDRRHQLYLYRKDREERGDTVNDHFALANGAHEHGMWDEERAHLTRILELDGSNSEARERLGHRRIDGRWVSPDQMEQAARDFERWALGLEEWAPRMQDVVRRLGLRSTIDRDSAEMELFSIHDPSAIPAVELLYGRDDETRTLRYLDWLTQVDAWEGAVALARQGVLADSTRVRIRARELLKSRRLDDFVPALLATLRVDSATVDRSLMWDGRFVFTYLESAELQHARFERVSLVSYVPVVTFHASDYPGIAGLRHGGSIETSGYFNDARFRAVADRNLNDRMRVSTRRFDSVQQRHDQLNRRVIRTLQHVTGRQLDEPFQWWDWWIAHNQVYDSGEKPLARDIYEEEWFVDDSGYPRPRTPRPGLVVRVRRPPGMGTPDICHTCSCFAAGTPVVTEDGLRPIEEIVLGDRVLAQDIETGQIDFKPVLKATVRPPSRLLRVTTDDGELICTGGHPYWINGSGWRCAFELERGMRFHSVNGSSEITSIEDAGRDERAYNLVVADFHNYFVGDGRILSHDNSPRSPTNALVPGLMPDWSVTIDDEQP